MGNSLITSGKPSQRREKRLFERLSCSYAQAPNRMELNMNPLLVLARSIASPSTPPLTPEKQGSDKEPSAPKAAIEQLPNEMWLEIMSYLSYNDLQQFRMVSWRCRDLVHRRPFMEKGKVIVTQHNLEAIHKHAKGKNCYLSFERVELRNLRQCSQLANFLRLVGHEVKHLQVRHAPVFRNLDGKLPNLKVLTIATTSSMDDQHLKAVDGLDMKQFAHLVGFECDGVSLDSSLKLLMLLQLRRKENKVQLRHLQFEFRRNNESALLDVLRDHADTLVCVDIFFSCSPGIDTREWCQAFETMHNLRTLKLSGNCHLVLLEAVLRAVPESAPIRQLDLTGMLSLTNELLLYIAGKWQSTLKVLDLMFCVQLNINCIDALRQLSGQLEALTMAYCRELTGMGLVQGLAGSMNYTLQELHLEETIFLDENSMCQLLERLPNLRRLSLDNCRQAVTDRTMATICQYQVKLRNLNIDYCVKITDQGLIGYGDNPYPISRLRGLKELNLRGCRNLTDTALKEGLKLPELRALSLGYCSRLTSAGFEAVTQNCPALESLCVSSCLAVDDEIVLSIVSHLKRLRILNLSNCAKLSLQSIHHILAHGHNLVELIACSIDGLDHEQAQRILEAQRPQMKQVLL
ncbi:dynein regulatory complex subunit 6 [Drosophila biarmipes]|uniref:dynein regulatory complex subunit 6 n=1 Tax=Drosophila biarmipes TaxID=125945 RepID=UPI0007E6482F|nr:dynein regulatory complex subunit 6 [Drosophila biarmipes]